MDTFVVYHTMRGKNGPVFGGTTDVQAPSAQDAINYYNEDHGSEHRKAYDAISLSEYLASGSAR